MALVESKVDPCLETEVGREVRSKAVSLSVKNVLFAADFSVTSASALPYAAAICRHFSSTLHTAHVLSDASLMMMTGGVDYVSMGTLYDDAHAEAKEKLEHLVGGLDDIPRFNYVRHGHIWRNLAAIIESKNIDLIVLGTHGRTGLGKLLLGSVAEDILRHATCPVLTVGPKVDGHAKLPQLSDEHLAPLELELRQIVFATNFSKNAEIESRQAVSLAQEFRSRLALVHVIEDYTQLGNQPAPIEEGIQKIKALLPPDAALQYPPETLLEFGSAPERVLKVAGDLEADMIILGAHSYSDIGSTHLPWSAAHHVIAHAHCPVLTIHP